MRKLLVILEIAILWVSLVSCDENGTYADCGLDSIYNFANIVEDWSFIEGSDKAYCGNGLSSTVVLIRTE